MGACASVSKSMRAEATETAPAPEQPKEETPAVAVEETGKAVEVADEVVVEDKKVADVCDKDIVEGEAPKEDVKEEESVTEAKTEAPEPVVVAPKEEEKSEVAPPPAAVEAEACKEEEKKTEVAEQK